MEGMSIYINDAIVLAKMIIVLLYAGNYRLRPSAFEVKNWLFTEKNLSMDGFYYVLCDNANFVIASIDLFGTKKFSTLQVPLW